MNGSHSDATVQFLSGPKWKRLRWILRGILALGAGGAFAVLAWEPPPGEDDSQAAIFPQTAERRGVVTEDDPRPQFDRLRRAMLEPADGTAAVARSQNLNPNASDDGRRESNVDASSAVAKGQWDEAGRPDDTAPPHLRGPP